MGWVASQRREIVDEGGRRVLAGQLRLLEAKRAEVEAPAGAGPDDGLANDLAGIRFVLRAALLSQGLTDVGREELERPEHEARQLLRRAVAGTGEAGGGGAPWRRT